MSHTNVDSGKTFHLDNNSILYIDVKEKKFESPEGGINLRGKNIKKECLEIPFVPECRLIDDDGKTILYRARSLQEVKSKQVELEEKGNGKTTKTSSLDDVIR